MTLERERVADKTRPSCAIALSVSLSLSEKIAFTKIQVLLKAHQVEICCQPKNTSTGFGYWYRGLRLKMLLR